MSAVARRYAKAVFSLAKDDQALEPTAGQLQQIGALVDDASLGPVLRSPVLAPTRRRELSQSLARELALSPLLTRFLALLADQQRLGELPMIADYFQHLLDEELGRVRIAIRSATGLDQKQRDDIVAVFAQLTRKQILPTVAVDANLLGGVVVEVAGKVYDGSVRTQLDRMAKELTGTASL